MGAIVAGEGVSAIGTAVEGAVVGISAITTGWIDMSGTAEGGGAIEDTGAGVAGSGDRESGDDVEPGGVDADVTGTSVGAGVFDRPGCTTVGDSVSRRGDRVGSTCAGPGVVDNGGTDEPWTWVGHSVAGGVEAIAEGTAAVVPGDTVPKYGALVEGPRAGVGVVGNGVPEGTGAGAGSCTVAGIGPMVEGDGVCEIGASSVGWVELGAVEPAAGPGVPGTDEGSFVAETSGATLDGDSVFGT